MLSLALRLGGVTRFGIPTSSKTLKKTGLFVSKEKEFMIGTFSSTFDYIAELELELIQPHMTQKPMLRGEVDARALRV